MGQTKLLVSVAMASAAGSALVTWCGEGEKVEEEEERQMCKTEAAMVDRAWWLATERGTQRLRGCTWWAVSELFDIITGYLEPMDLAAASSVRGVWLEGVVRSLKSYSSTADRNLEIKKKTIKREVTVNRRGGVRAESYESLLEKGTSYRIESCNSIQATRHRKAIETLSDERVRAVGSVSGLTDALLAYQRRIAATEAWRESCARF
eukprot:TRINITY_DN12741_c0_g1_i1.p1 TRINITY_DN12741_c0_g1~~TRINITY_DN12741_c0_g1_i1.p1  ORF type:complete len:207 (+),score=18.55 TRINITY_DN12741_c0_g1_i1:65-685(+)